MSAFPTIANPKVMPLKVKAFVYRSDPNLGAYSTVRKQATRALKSWRLSWDETHLLTAAHKALLEAHFVANAGASFPWTHPTAGTTHTVTYAVDEIEFAEPYLRMGYWSTETTLQEV